MNKSLLVFLLSTILSVVTLFGAVQSKRVLVGIYKTEKALLEAKRLLRSDPALVKIKRDFGFETVSRMQGSKRVLYLETFSKTKDLLSTFVVISRKFPDSFIEEYVNTTPKAYTSDELYAKSPPRQAVRDPFAPEETQSEVADEPSVPEPIQDEVPDTVEPDIPNPPEPGSMLIGQAAVNPTTIDQFTDFEPISGSEDEEGVLWERVVLDDEEPSERLDSFDEKDALPIAPSVAIPEPAKRAIEPPASKPVLDDTEWELDFMKAPTKVTDVKPQRALPPKEEPAEPKQVVPVVKKEVRPVTTAEGGVNVEADVTPVTTVDDGVNAQYLRKAQQPDSVLDEVHEIKVVLDTKSMLLLLAGVIVLLWFYKRHNSPKKEDPFEYNSDGFDDIVMQPDTQEDLVDLLIKKKGAKSASKKKGVDIFETADNEISPEWEIKAAPKQQKESPISSFPLVVDLHSHMIPGIDDGSKSMKESVAMVRQLHALGYRKVITTPHIMSHRYPNTSKIILDGLERLREELDRQGVDIVVEAAAEYYLDEHLRDLVNKKEILTFGKNCLLFELSYNVKPINLERWIVMIRDAGYQPVLAHPERYQYMRRNFKMYEELKLLGLYLQVNINSLNGFYAPEAKQTALRLAEKGMIDFLGSDAHAIRHLQALGKTVKTDMFAKIFKNNPIKNNTLLI